MIRFLPNIYPDEALFSYLSRCYARSGYIWNSGFAKEVFKTNAKNIDCTLLNVLSLQFKELIDQYIGLDKIILEHTLFKYYARFLPLSKRKNVFQRALRNEPFLSQHLPIPLNTNTSCLRYCPICVKEDQATYGEAYIHTTHTIPEIITCPKHCCKLIHVEFIKDKINNTSFIPIEIAITDLTEDIFEENDINVKVSRYIASAFLEPLNTSKEMIIGNFLSNKLEDKYISARGEQRRLEILFPDMQNFYFGLCNFNLTKSRLARIYKNSSYNPYDILLASMYQQIPPSILCSYNGSSKPKHILFDKRVRAMHQSGMSMNRISLELNVNHEVVRQILLGTYDKPKRPCAPYKCPKWNWEKIDEECCQEFYKKVAALDRCLITKGSVAELFGLRDKSLRNLPRLNALVISSSLGLSLVFEIFKPGKYQTFKVINYNLIDKEHMISVLDTQIIRYLYILESISDVILTTDEEHLTGTKINKTIRANIADYVRVIKSEHRSVHQSGVKKHQTWTYNICNLVDVTVEDDDEFVSDEEEDNE